MRSRLVLLPLLLTPLFAFAAPASFEAGRSLVTASSSAGNVYLFGGSDVITAPVTGDLTAAGGSLIVTAPVSGDALLAGGSINAQGRVSGDARIAGGSVRIDGPIGGDLAALAFSMHDNVRARGSVFVAGLSVDLADGAGGPVIVYGNNVSLAGDFAGNVRVVSSGSLTLAANTTIRGALTYDAPEPATIPASAHVLGGVHYTSKSYLPNSQVTRSLALASLGIFLLARIVGVLILAGLLAGLFPKLGEAITGRAASASVRRIFLTTLLGFAALVATPILLILIALTFIGLGIAILLFICYALLAFLAYLYAGIALGSLLVRKFADREWLSWRDGVLGMLLLSLVGLLPYVGGIIVFLLTVFAAGALLILFFDFAFPKEPSEGDLI